MPLPITHGQARVAAQWLKNNFGPQLDEAVENTPFTVNHLCAIACQETAYFWLPFIKKIGPQEVLARCVLDGSGDVTGAPRSAFPRNTAAFRQKYGSDFTNLLIEEGNKTRVLRGYKPWRYVYKGYGIFQYDLQFVVSDEKYFRQKQWYSIDECLKRVIHELDLTWKRHGNHWMAIKAYNGSGSRATQYANNVMEFMDVIA